MTPSMIPWAASDPEGMWDVQTFNNRKLKVRLSDHNDHLIVLHYQEEWLGAQIPLSFGEAKILAELLTTLVSRVSKGKRE